MNCMICNAAEFRIHEAREMMLGVKAAFIYRECMGCSCLRLMNIPEDMSPFYPNDAYYSFSTGFRQASGWKQALRQAILGIGGRGHIIRRSYPLVNQIIEQTGARCFSRILDVGCGSGSLVRRLRELGFKRATGLDPFAVNDPPYVRRCNLNEIDGEWDVVMFHHSFEHMEEPAETLRAVRRFLAPDGRLLIRMPVVNWAWKEYGTNWVALDAPRHIWLHTENSFRMLAAKNGFKVQQVIYDSSELQFSGSELYRRGIPLHSVDRAIYFSSLEIEKFRKNADELNARGLGDAAAFTLLSSSKGS